VSIPDDKERNTRGRISTIKPQALESRDTHEIVSVPFELSKKAEDNQALAEVRRLLGPGGSFSFTPLRGITIEPREGLPAGTLIVGTLIVIDEAGRVRQIRDVLKRAAVDAGKEQPEKPSLVVYQVVGISPDLALRVLQAVLAGAPDVRLSVDAKTGNLIVLARTAQHAVVRDVLERIRSGPKGDAGKEQGDAPRVEAYRLSGINPDKALEVLRPLLAGAPDVRLDADPNAGILIVMARPAQHAVVRDALERLRSSPKSAPAKPPKKIRFNFRHQAWKDVLDWLAEAADLSLVDSAPTGTFNYSDNREYTPAEAIDLVNSVLLTKGYTLVRRDRMLTVIHLDDVRQTEAIPIVPLEILDTRGEFEFVSVLFTLEKVKS
jgi:hypothetical protein